MGYYISSERMDTIIGELKKEYRIYAPKRFAKRGFKTNSDLIRYAEIDSIQEIVSDIKSDFSPKEIFYPIIQTLLYFTEDQCRESKVEDQKGILLFARACDIHGIQRLDTIFLRNGGTQDYYYKRLRDKIKIVLMECQEGWDSCFCVSMGTNRADHYSMAVGFDGEELLIEVKDDEFQPYFLAEPENNFTPMYVQENKIKVTLPEIKDSDHLKKAYNLGLWETFNSNCISCGGCNTVCISCSCFDTTDVLYHETSRNGERRRVWSSCMLEEFTTMAGGHKVRSTAGERMRFKTLHKVYDYNALFGGKEHMCIGCGRCSSRCPQEISFSETINQLSDALKNSSRQEDTTWEVVPHE